MSAGYTIEVRSELAADGQRVWIGGVSFDSKRIMATAQRGTPEAAISEAERLIIAHLLDYPPVGWRRVK